MRVPEPAKLYTWWSYRAADWETADKGRRLDHIWVAPSLADRVTDLHVRKSFRGSLRPSDHVPVTATFELEGG
jgi:exodeoxyribonuclease-3